MMIENNKKSSDSINDEQINHIESILKKYMRLNTTYKKSSLYVRVFRCTKNILRKLGIMPKKIPLHTLIPKSTKTQWDTFLKTKYSI